MRQPLRERITQLEELRRLLLSRERKQLLDLEDRVSDKERRSHDVAGVLPEAVKLSRERGEELSRALRPAVEGSIRESIEKRPETFVDALHPIIGPMVRRSIAESLRRLMQSLNQTLEHTFSWQGLKWRFEALRTGKSFGEVVMLRSLIYRIEQLFLIHRETSLSLLHVTDVSAIAKDSDMVAGMLSAIQDFVRDSFETGKDSALEEFRVGELQVWIAAGRYAYLAAVIRGNPPRELRTTLEDTIESIHILKGSELAKFQGDTAVFESVRPELEACLQSQYSASKSKGSRHLRAWAALAGVAAIAIFAIVLAARSESQWRNFIGRLNAEPGTVVTDSHKGWISASRVSGLRDRSSADPADIARASGVNPAKVHFDWKDFLALDPASVLQRFEHRFEIPLKARATIKDGVLNLSGPIPYEWLERVRREATLVPGITAVADQDAQVIYDPNLALKRFDEKFGRPDGMNVTLATKTITISGAASHRWLMEVRSEAAKLPGLNSIVERDVIDLDQQTFQRSKSVIETAFVYFLPDKDDIATEGFAALSRLPDEINRCENAAKQIGLDMLLEIRGYADATGEEAKNADLRQRRANKVRDFLVSCGFNSTRLKPVGIEQDHSMALGEKPLPDQSDRRVAFKVISHPAEQSVSP